MAKFADPKHPYHVWVMTSQKGRVVRWRCASGEKCNATKTTFNGRPNAKIED